VFLPLVLLPLHCLLIPICHDLASLGWIPHDNGQSAMSIAFFE